MTLTNSLFSSEASSNKRLFKEYGYSYTLEHSLDKSQMEIERNTEFRILWPRGELGSLPDDARQDMLIEGLQIDVIGLREIEKEVHELTIRIGTIEALREQDPE